MDEAQKEKFRKQLKSYKRDLGLDQKEIKKPLDSLLEKKNLSKEKKIKFNKSIDFDKEISSLQQKIAIKKIKNSSVEPVKEIIQDEKKNIGNSNKTATLEDNKIEEKSQNEEIVKEKEDNKKSKLAFIATAILLLLIGCLTYRFNTNNPVSKLAKIETNTQPKTNENGDFIKDSILVSENSKIEINEQHTKLLSTTIVNVKSDNPQGYYAVLGAYGKLKNAEKLQKTNTTVFDAYIFDGKMKRVALLIGSEEDSITKNLEIIKLKYPDAWIMYNHN